MTACGEIKKRSCLKRIAKRKVEAAEYIEHTFMLRQGLLIMCGVSEVEEKEKRGRVHASGRQKGSPRFDGKGREDVTISCARGKDEDRTLVLLKRLLTFF